MNFPTTFHPRRFLDSLLAIDREAALARKTETGYERRATIVLSSVAVSLLLLHYLKFRSSFVSLLRDLETLFGQVPGVWLRALQAGGFFDLIAYAWWGFWHVVAYVLIPLIVLSMIGQRPADCHLGWNRLSRHWHWYAVLCAPILCFIVPVSLRADFAAHYPFYAQASRSWLDLLVWELIYGLQFVCLEFFFRGYMLATCKPAFGANAVFVMAVPYLMIHFAKPWLEATGAILFGIFLGVLALRSASIWGGVIVHLSVAYGMDIAALLQGPGLPQRLWP